MCNLWWCLRPNFLKTWPFCCVFPSKVVIRDARECVYWSQDTPRLTQILFLYSVLWPVRSLWSHMWSWIFQENPTQLSSTFSRWWGNCLNLCFLLLVLGQLSAQLTKSFSTSFTRLPCIEALDSPFAAFVFHLYCLKREVWAVVMQGCHGRGKTTK